MHIRNALRTVGNAPQALIEASLASERVLEDMIVAAPRIPSDEWMHIGRHERIGMGGTAPAGARELERDNESEA